MSGVFLANVGNGSILLNARGRGNFVKPKNFVGLMNAYSQGMSGGDARFLEVVKRVSSFFDRVTIISSSLGVNVARVRGVTSHFVSTSNETKFSRVIPTYIIRALRAILLVGVVEDGDILYVSSDFVPDVFPAAFFKLRKKVRYVQMIFHIIPRSRPVSHYAQRVTHELAKVLADVVIVDNELLREDLVQNGFRREKVILNPPGIDTYRAVSMPPIQRKFDATFLGRLSQSKGIFDLVSVWKIVTEKLERATLAIIGQGDGVTMRKLRTMIAENGLGEKISVFAQDLNEERFGLLKSGKVFVFPSHEEGFGMAIVEAMACGMPVVAWNLPSYSASFSGGIVKIPRFDLRRFANAVIEVLGNDHLRARLSDEAKEEAIRYEWDKIIPKELRIMMGSDELEVNA